MRFSIVLVAAVLASTALAGDMLLTASGPGLNVYVGKVVVK
jgi:hypothetical protein